MKKQKENVFRIVPIEFKEDRVSKKIVFSDAGIFLEKIPKKGEKTRIALSNLGISKIIVCEEPPPYKDGRFLSISLEKNQKILPPIVGTPEEIVSRLTHLHKDQLAQALLFYANAAKNVEIAPRSNGFYLVENQIRFFGKFSEFSEKLEDLEDEIKFLENLILSYPNPSKFALIFVFFVSAMLTPIRKALHVENPGLLIRGERATGKTTFTETVLFSLLGETVESGQSIATPARFARLANTRIITVVDEAEKMFKAAQRDSSVIEIFKAIHTTNAVVRSVLTRDRNIITEYSRANFIYIMNPLTLKIDEAMKRRLMTVVLSKEDHLKKKKPVPRRRLPSLFAHLVDVIQENSEEILDLIRTETSHKDFLDTGLVILNHAGLEDIARLAEDVIADISFEDDDIFDEEAEAVAEVRKRIASMVRGAKNTEEAERRLEQSQIEGIFLRDGYVYITSAFIAGLKTKIKLKQLAEKLREQGLDASYTQLWLKGNQNPRAVKIPLEEVLPS